MFQILNIKLISRFLLFFGIFLVILGSLFVSFDQVGYLWRKRRLEINHHLGLLPDEGPDTYYNQTVEMNIRRQYNFVVPLGNGLSSVGFWVLSLSLILIGLTKSDLPEKLRLVIIVGGFVVMVLLAYGLYALTFSISGGFGQP